MTNDPCVIAQNYKMVSVNTALQVDLIRPSLLAEHRAAPLQRHVASSDTHRGAQMSAGGRASRPAPTARGGSVSTIVPVLAEGAEVTVPSQDVDTVVTEYGVAELKGRSVKDRMKALIQIAHPDFRAWIQEEAERLNIVPRLVVSGFQAPHPAGSATAPGVTADTIRLGTFCDLSGPNATIGMAALRGYSAYYDHINHWGGVHGRKIEMIVKDDRFDPGRTQVAARELITQDEVFAIVSPLGTPTNLAVLEYLLHEQIPVISPHSGVSQWSTPLKRTYFALQPSYRVEGQLLAQYVLDELRPSSVGIFFVDDEFGWEGVTALRKELSRAGVEPVVTVTHSVGESTPSNWLAALMDRQPSLVVLYTYVKPAADLLRAAHQAGFRPDWLGSYVVSGPDLFQLAGPEATHGLRATSYPAGPRYHRGEVLFRKLLTRGYADESPGTHSRIGYAAAQLVVEGLQRVGPNLTRDSLIAALEGIQDWSGGLCRRLATAPPTIAPDRPGLDACHQRPLAGRKGLPSFGNNRRIINGTIRNDHQHRATCPQPR